MSSAAPSSSSGMCLGGLLVEFPVGDVLTFLNMGMKTGALEVESSAGTADIYLRDGEVIFASSNLRRFRISDFLVARGILTEALANRFLGRARTENRPFREVLINSGIIDEEEVQNIEKIMCGEIAFEALRWRDGKFRFLRDCRPPDPRVQLRIGIQNLILEGVRRHDEAMRFEQEVQIDRAMGVTLVCATGMLEQEVVLTPMEWGVISLINGKRTLGEILDLSPAESELSTWRILQRLQTARLILIHERALPDVEGTLHVNMPGLTQQVPVVPGGMLAPLPLPPQPPAGDFASAENSDVKLFTTNAVTSSQRVFGKRLPARLLAGSDAAQGLCPFDLSSPVLTVGRSNSNDLVLPDLSISKQHAQFMQDSEGWRVVDLGSTNGTFVNGEKVQEKRLQAGDAIRIGLYLFNFEQGAPVSTGWAR